MKKFLVLGILPILIFASCSLKNTRTNGRFTMHENPLLQEFAAPHALPPFKQIRNEHYEPAFAVAIKRHNEEIAQIIKNPQDPSFANVIEALESSGALLERIERVFSNLKSANSDDDMRALGEKMASVLAAHEDDINLNSALFDKIKAVYAGRSALNLSEEQSKLLEDTYRQFQRAGAELSPEIKEQLKQLNQKLTVLSEQFGNNVLEETAEFELWLSTDDEISGIPPNVLQNAEIEAKGRAGKGRWLFTTDRSSFTPFMSYAANRNLRKRMFEAYTKRGSQGGAHDNLGIAANMASLRAQRAQLLGFKTHADYVLDDEMAKNPQQVEELLNSIWPSALKAAKKERDEMIGLARTQDQKFEFMAWDWWYYAEKLRLQKFSYDENLVSEYFSLDKTREGTFYVAQKLFGLRFKERLDLPIYHEDVRTFEVFDAANKLVGIYYADYFRRNGKQGGAWMDEIRPQMRHNGQRVIPVIINVLNLSKPEAGLPALLSLEEANTLFHEFGHALHGLLSDVKYHSQCGTNVPRDFVEFPSQVYENWMLEEEVLNHFAKHYQTGKTIPKSLVEKIKETQRFNQGFNTVEYMAAAYLDLAWHSLKDSKLQDAQQFETQVLGKLGVINEIAPRYKTGYFLHAFSGGYSAGYYSYLWSQVLDADAFAIFQDKGIFNAETAKRYQNMLSSGGSKKAMRLFLEFSGRGPERAALIKRLGFAS